MASAGTVTIDFQAQTAQFTRKLRKFNDRIDDFHSRMTEINSAIEHSLEMQRVIDAATREIGRMGEILSLVTPEIKIR